LKFEKSSVYRILRDNGIVVDAQIEPYAPRVRDRDDVQAFRCAHSGVIFLDRTDHIDIDYYAGKVFADGAFKVGERRIPYIELDNAERQVRRFGHLIEGKDWLDFGCGQALLLRKLGPQAAQALGVEPGRWYADAARAEGLNIVSSLDEIGGRLFDVITLFHVFEHLAEPVELARCLRSFLKPGGVLLVEVPHARDFLLETLNSAEFRSFTLWSEHLVLHTRQSLRALLNAAGFEHVDVEGLQRYPLSNHLYWLRHGQPGGHEKWADLNNADLMSAYEATLDLIDQTDTIVGLARK
jgi:2-polyprenyl-3-methyl-5-hydroxy-6-metoxy-1,4-benzoquinol methylase